MGVGDGLHSVLGRVGERFSALGRLLRLLRRAALPDAASDAERAYGKDDAENDDERLHGFRTEDAVKKADQSFGSSDIGGDASAWRCTICALRSASSPPPFVAL